ncbi:hypothetical protein QJQ45_009948 [Haematococcus lacustris]|nr:hypothetical protein QJQ45_009948 [Haematococcus lacustris]
MACGYGINAKSSELKAATLDKGHVADLIEEANKHRRLLGMNKEGSLQDTLPLPCRMCTTAARGGAADVDVALHDPELPSLGLSTSTLTSTVIKVPGGAVLRGCKKTKRRLLAHLQLRAQIYSQLRVIVSFQQLLTGTVDLTLILILILSQSHCLSQSEDPVMLRQLKEFCESLANPQLQDRLQPGAAVACSQAFLCALCAWLQSEKEMAEVYMERYGCVKQLVFFDAAGIGTRGGWGADAVLRACCKVGCRPRGTDQRRGRVVLVDEHRTTRVSSAVYGQQPCEEELDRSKPTRPADWKPPAGQVEHCLLRPAWSQQRD